MTFLDMVEKDFETFFDNNYFAISAVFSNGTITKNINCIFDDSTEAIDTYGEVVQLNPTLTAPTKIINENIINTKWTVTVNGTIYKIKNISHNSDLTSLLTLGKERM